MEFRKRLESRRGAALSSVAFAAAIMFLLACPASATVIVDTGQGPTSFLGVMFGDPGYGYSVWVAAEFSLAQPTTITSVEGWMASHEGDSPSVDIAIYSDGGDVPGSLVYSSSTFMPGPNIRCDWHGVYGLDWQLGAGSWWVAFRPAGGQVLMGAPSMSPLLNEAGFVVGPNQGNYWLGADYYDIGVRISGDPVQAVPEPATTSMLLLGGSLLGLAARRRRRAS